MPLAVEEPQAHLQQGGTCRPWKAVVLNPFGVTGTFETEGKCNTQHVTHKTKGFTDLWEAINSPQILTSCS